MTLTLILTRHGKSSWDNPRLEDYDRPLADRGHRSATAIGDWLARIDFVPGEVIHSGARRTAKTWEDIRARLPAGPTVREERDLYHAGANTLLRVLRAAQDPVTMMIGHNPGFAEFANRILMAPADHPRFADYPTCATAIIGFDEASWDLVNWKRGRLIDFAIPRELMQ